MSHLSVVHEDNLSIISDFNLCHIGSDPNTVGKLSLIKRKSHSIEIEFEFGRMLMVVQLIRFSFSSEKNESVGCVLLSNLLCLR